jgi:hypothetical protein
MIKGGKTKMWNEINSNEDLSNFMDMHYGFHDSCLKELKYISGAYANEKFMHPRWRVGFKRRRWRRIIWLRLYN